MTNKFKEVMNTLEAEGMSVSAQTVIKNGTPVDALIIKEVADDYGDNRVAPAFYPDQFEDCDSETVAKRIKETLSDAKDFGRSCISDAIKNLEDKEYILDNVRYRMVKAGTENAYADVPHIMWQDIPVLYCVSPGENMNVILKKEMLDHLAISMAELDQAAEANGRRLYSNDIRDMAEVLSSITRMEVPPSAVPVKVIGRSGTVGYGAASILALKDEIEKLAEANGGLTLIPSSVHEWILLYGIQDPDKINCMIRDVNASEVRPEEVLSDHAYLITDDGRIMQAIDGDWAEVQSSVA